MKFSRFAAQALVLSVLLGASSAFAAFSGPVAAPPEGNVAPPITVSSAFQQKLGALWAASIGTDAGYCIRESCISDWSQAGKQSACPTGFARVAAGNGRVLGCVQNVTQKSSYTQALNDCWNTYGARLPSYAELSIVKTTLRLTLPTDMWLDSGSSRPAGDLSSYRCFIPAGA